MTNTKSSSTTKKTRTTNSANCKDKNNCCNNDSTTKKSRATEIAQENCSLSDCDIASDVLGAQKSLISKYSVALCEIDCKNLRSIISNQMTEIAKDQLDVFLYMNERGMYKTEPAPLQKVKEAREKFCSTAKKLKK